MPLTLPQEEYIALMSQKGVEDDESRTHHLRMTKMKDAFLSAHPDLGLFGAVDVGSHACWWDYGQLKLYVANNRKLAEEGADADLLRRFFGVTSRRAGSALAADVAAADSACVFSCRARRGSVGAGAAVAGVAAEELVVGADAIVVNCAARKIVAGAGAVLYNLVSDAEEGIVAGDGDVVVAVTDAAGTSTVLRSKTDICGGKAWKQVLDGNSVSFEEMHRQNKNANVSTIEKKRKELFQKISSSLDL